ncbi:MAG: FHA domain-containing protein, partial [Anaerolineales bacterium]
MRFQDEAYLEGLTGEFVGREFNLIEGETTIGRGKENIIQVLDPKASRAHAVIRFKDGRYTLEDLGSSGGTRINGELVSTAELQNNDTITIGETTFKAYNVVDIESAATIRADEDAVPTMMQDENAVPTGMVDDDAMPTVMVDDEDPFIIAPPLVAAVDPPPSSLPPP